MLPVGTDLRLSNIPRVTMSLIVINVITFIFWDLLPYEDMSSRDYYLESCFSVFLHADFSHLFGNMLFLWVFGSYLEDKTGSKRFLFYYFVCEIGASALHLVFDGRPAIGASGAISGIMGVYLFRCHYSKIKTIVPVLIWFIKVNINAIYLLAFWILRDMYDAVNADNNIANWAHIGGYLSGIIIGKVNNYWQTAKVEDLYDRAADALRTMSGTADAEKDLLEIIDIDPDHADAHSELARYYANHSQKKDKGRKHYLAAARVHYMKQHCSNMAGEIFLEYLNRYNEPQEPALHFKYASTLSDVGNYYGASRILEPFIAMNEVQGVIGEKIFMNYIQFSLKADLKEDAQYAFETFQKSCTDSLQLKRAESFIRLHKPGSKKKVQIERAEVSGKGSNIMDNLKDMTSDPMYWIILLFFFNLFQGSLFLIPVFLALALMYPIHHIGSSFGSIFGGRYRSEDEGLREYNINKFMDKARVCERNEQYEETIEYLKAVLEEDKNQEHHMAVRYQIARLYHKKTNQPQEAIQEYQIILKTAPKDHPFKRDAYWSIKELSGLPS